MAEIGELIALDSTQERALVDARIAALDERIAELRDVRARLSQPARECGEGKAGPCPIIASFG